MEARQHETMRDGAGQRAVEARRGVQPRGTHIGGPLVAEVCGEGLPELRTEPRTPCEILGPGDEVLARGPWGVLVLRGDAAGTLDVIRPDAGGRREAQS